MHLYAESDPTTGTEPSAGPHRPRLRTWVALAVASALTMLMIGGTALAATHHKTTAPLPVVAGSQYLALGDSVTFGYVEPQVVPTPNYKDASSFTGYPELLASELHLKLANAACPGETSASFINTSAQSNGCENTPGAPTVGYRASGPVSGPLHVSYSGSQLAYALSYLRHHHNVRLVTLMIGANDGLLCIETENGCATPAEVAALDAEVGNNIRHILKAIRHKAHYEGQLVVVNYYSPLAELNAFTISGNQVMDAAATRFGAHIADGYGAFQAAESRSGGNPCTAGLLTQLGSPSDCGIHPSYAGQALLAEAVEKAIRL
jgi:lysophospholipase L1-like esterase